jgi:hypothetical protein
MRRARSDDERRGQSAFMAADEGEGQQEARGRLLTRARTGVSLSSASGMPLGANDGEG